MERQEKDARASQRDRGAQSDADDAEVAHQHNAEDQVRRSLDEHDGREDSMAADPEEDLSRSCLRGVKSRGKDQDQQDRIAGEVLWPNPNFNQGPAQDDERRANRENSQRAGAIPGDEHFSKPFGVAGRIELARHRRKDLGQALNNVSRVIDQLRPDRKERDRRRRKEHADHECIGLEAEPGGNDDHEGRRAVADELAKTSPVNELRAEREGQTSTNHQDVGDGAEQGEGNCNEREGHQPAAAVQGHDNEPGAKQDRNDLYQVQPVELLKSLENAGEQAEGEIESD